MTCIMLTNILPNSNIVNIRMCMKYICKCIMDMKYTNIAIDCFFCFIFDIFR